MKYIMSILIFLSVCIVGGYLCGIFQVGRLENVIPLLAILCAIYGPGKLKQWSSK